MKRILTICAVVVMLFANAVAEDAVTTLTYFPQNSMATSGELYGGLSTYFRDRGLVIDTVAYSTARLQSMLASGDLCDVMWLPEQELKAAMRAGYLLDLTPYLEDMPNIHANSALFQPSLNFAREYNSNGTGNVYYLAPVGDPAVAVAADTDRHAIKMNWEMYSRSGYPTFSTLEESIGVFTKMKQDTPFTQDGVPTYALHMFADYDTDYFYNMYSVYAVLGKSCDYLSYGIEWDYRTHTGESIFVEGSTYYRGLKFFYEMNKAGLIDPDSLVQTRAAASEKVSSGAALAGWAANPGWEAYGGYYPVLFDEFVPSYKSVSPYGTAGYCISADCKNPDAAVRFLDLLASDDAVMTLRNGPCGYNWNVDENGRAYLTEYFFESLDTERDLVDANGDAWYFWNITYLLNLGYVTGYGVPYVSANWSDMYAKLYSSEQARDWTKLYGYPYLKELLAAENWEQAIETEGYEAFLSTDDSDMSRRKAALKDIIVSGSWQMIYAESAEEFDGIWLDMQQQCEKLGLNEVIEYKLKDIANARRIYQALIE